MTGNRKDTFLTRCLATAAVVTFYCLATVTASGLVATATSMSAEARPHGGPHAGPHHFAPHPGGSGHFVGHRRMWHGHWYPYGVGPCWIRTPVGWIWNIAACP